MKKANKIRIAFLVDDFNNEYSLKLSHGVLKAAKDLGISIVVFCIGALGNPTLFYGMRNRLIPLISPKDFDGILYQSACLSNCIGAEKFLEYFKKFQSTPSAHLGIVSPRFKCFNINNESGMYDLVSHMIKVHGRRKIAFVGGPPGVHDAEERFSAYKRALEDNGIEFDTRYVYDGNFLREAGILAVEYFLDDRKIEFDALIGANDRMALYAMKELQSRGFSIPEDISIGGFDDLSCAKSHQPTLTTVHQPVYQLGYKSLTDFVQDLTNEGVQSGNFQFSSELIIRYSCGCKGMNNETTYTDNSLTLFPGLSTDERDELDSIMNMTTRNIMGSFDESEIRDILDESLKIFDIEDFTLSKYKDNENSLVFYDSKKPYGEEFPSHYLVGDKIDSFKTPFCKFVMPLFHREEDIGFFISDLGSKALNVLEVLRDHLAGALKGAQLLNDAKQYSKKLEQMVDERTSELMKRSRELEEALDTINLSSKKLEKLAVMDELTSLYNRRGFMTIAKKNFELVKRKKSDMLLVFFDLDGLKNINDNFGHAAGDIAIKTMGEILVKVFRKSDIIARLGGDEFTVFAIDCTIKEYSIITERMNSLIDDYNQSSGNGFNLSVSCGAAPCSQSINHKTLEELISEADSELYKNKKQKKRTSNKE